MRFGVEQLKNLYRWLIAFALLIIPWAIGAGFGTYLGVLAGIVASYAFLTLTNGNFRLPILHWERLSERKIQFFLSLLGLAHLIPGLIVAVVLADYLYIFVIAAIGHLGLETFVILNRPPKDPNPKKPIRYSFRRARSRGTQKEGGSYWGF